MREEKNTWTEEKIAEQAEQMQRISIKFSSHIFPLEDKDARLKEALQKLENLRNDIAEIRKKHEWSDEKHSSMLERAATQAEQAGFRWRGGESISGGLDVYDVFVAVSGMQPREKVPRALLFFFVLNILNCVHYSVNLIKEHSLDMIEALEDDPPAVALIKQGRLFSTEEIPPILRRVEILEARRVIERAAEALPLLLKIVDFNINGEKTIAVAARHGEYGYQGITDVLLKTFNGDISINHGEQTLLFPRGKTPKLKTIVELSIYAGEESKTLDPLDKIEELDAWDKAIYNAVGTYISEWNNDFFTAKQLFYALTGDNKDMPNGMETAIEESLIKMSRIRIKVLLDSREYEKNPRLLPSYEGQLLNLEIFNNNVVINGKIAKKAFRHNNNIPILYAISKARGHILRTPMTNRRIAGQIAGKREGDTRALRSGGEKGKILVEQYLEQRIGMINNPKNSIESRLIKIGPLYDMYFVGCEGLDPEKLKWKKQDARKFFATLLDQWTKNGTTGGYSFVKTRREITHIKIEPIKK